MTKRILAFVFFVLLIIAGLAGWNYYASHQKLNLVYDESAVNVRVDVFKDGEVVATTNNTESLRLKKGRYEVVSAGTDTFEETRTSVDLQSKTETVTINPDYSKSNLAGMLEGKEPEIQEVIKRTINIPPTYRLNPGELFVRGEWYGTTIVPNLSDEELRLDYVDVYRIVLKKEGNTWVVVSKKPELFVNKFDLPDVPSSVLDKTNKLFGDDEI